MTVLKMPDGAIVDFGDRSRGEITALIAKKYPDLVKATPSERFSEATAGAPDPANPRFGLQARTEAAAAAAAPDEPLPAFSLTGPDEFTSSVGTGIVRLPGHVLGAAGDLISGYAAPVGAMIGDIARRATGKEGFATLEEATANDPADLKNIIPTSEDVLNKASEITGVTLHQPKGPVGAVGEIIGGALVGPKLAAPAAERAAASAPAVPPPTTATTAARPATAIAPRHPAIKEVISSAKEEAGTSGRQLGPALREQLRSSISDPEFMARFSPEDQATLRAVAAGKVTEKGAALVARIADNPMVGWLSGGHAGWVKSAAKGYAQYATAKNIRILNSIVGGGEEAAPAVAAAAPAATPVRAPAPAPARSGTQIMQDIAAQKTAATERAALDRPPAPAPATPAAKLDEIAAAAPATPVTPAQRLDWATQRRENWNTPQRELDNEIRARIDRLKVAREKPPEKSPAKKKPRKKPEAEANP